MYGCRISIFSNLMLCITFRLHFHCTFHLTFSLHFHWDVTKQELIGEKHLQGTKLQQFSRNFYRNNFPEIWKIIALERLDKNIYWSQFLYMLAFFSRAHWRQIQQNLATVQIVRALTFQTFSEVTKRLHHINLLFFR